MNESCGSLINPDGSLTSAGDTAVGCITNGAIATVIASHFNIPLDTIKSLLGGLAGLTGCGGIVNMDQIQTSRDLRFLGPVFLSFFLIAGVFLLTTRTKHNLQ